MASQTKDQFVSVRITPADSELLDEGVKKGLGRNRGDVIRALIDINFRNETPENQIKLQVVKIFEANPIEFAVYMYHRLLYLTKSDKELSEQAGVMAFALKELVRTLFGVEGGDVYKLRDDIFKTISEPIATTNIAKPEQSQTAQKQDNGFDAVIEFLINQLRKDIEREKNWQKTVDSIICILNIAEVWNVQNPLTQRLVEAANLEDITEKQEKFKDAFKDFTLIIPEILIDEAFRKAVLDGVLAHIG